ncbi:SAM-dependent methyltransferase [Spirochaetia bacterium]|nr:SAM-dependent methyltransferase [Spirochaetia bacterium]
MPYKKEWFNDDPFWEQYAPIMFDAAHWAEVPAVADGITRLAKLPLYMEDRAAAPAGRPRCLDLCCGFGRVGLELARRGFAVTGVDITKSYLETAREDAARENLEAEFIHGDVREFARPETFDIAINLYNSFGYFEDPAGDKLLIQNAFTSLKPGGVFFIETLGKEIMARDFTAGEWFRRAGFFVVTEYEILDSWGAIKNTWHLIRENTDVSTASTASAASCPVKKTFVHRLYAASELRRLFLEAGFSQLVIYGDWDERPYNEQAVKLIAAGRK